MYASLGECENESSDCHTGFAGSLCYLSFHLQDGHVLLALPSSALGYLSEVHSPRSDMAPLGQWSGPAKPLQCVL